MLRENIRNLGGLSRGNWILAAPLMSSPRDDEGSTEVAEYSIEEASGQKCLEAQREHPGQQPSFVLAESPQIGYIWHRLSAFEDLAARYELWKE
jgi:hypothetical protein